MICCADPYGCMCHGKWYLPQRHPACSLLVIHFMRVLTAGAQANELIHWGAIRLAGRVLFAGANPF
jgi:hypothetical protein